MQQNMTEEEMKLLMATKRPGETNQNQIQHYDAGMFFAEYETAVVQ